MNRDRLHGGQALHHLGISHPWREKSKLLLLLRSGLLLSLLPFGCRRLGLLSGRLAVLSLLHRRHRLLFYYAQVIQRSPAPRGFKPFPEPGKGRLIRTEVGRRWSIPKSRKDMPHSRRSPAGTRSPAYSPIS